MVVTQSANCTILCELPQATGLFEGAQRVPPVKTCEWSG